MLHPICLPITGNVAMRTGPKFASEAGMCWSRPEMRNATGGEASDGRSFSAGGFHGELARHAEPGHRQGLQVFEWDCRPAVLAVSVGPDLEPVQCGVDVGQDGPCGHGKGMRDLLSGRIF